jgi:FG-GAP repeat protein
MCPTQVLFRLNYDSDGNLPSSIAVGDVNGDNRPDIVVANFKSDPQPLTGSASVAVFLNKGTDSIVRN